MISIFKVVFLSILISDENLGGLVGVAVFIEPPDVHNKITWKNSCPVATDACPHGYYGRPPLLVVSLDSFHSDYLTRGLTPTLNNLYHCGTKSDYMYPVFPTKTFPNLYSIATGLYPSAHGVVANDMYDPKEGRNFSIGGEGSSDPFWWEGEPIWVTAQKQGKRSAIILWPGSEVKYNDTTFANDFVDNINVTFSKRVDQIMDWLERPRDTRPSLLMLYAHEPDGASHTWGISSRQANETLVAVDKMMSRLILRLQMRRLLNCINIVIIADHGMVDAGCDRTIYLEDYIDIREINGIFGVYAQMTPKDRSVTRQIISDLQCKHQHMRVYPIAQLPVRYHYTNHPRIQPIFINLDLKWNIEKSRRDNNSCLTGNHGYDNYYKEMRPIFMAYGPSFMKYHTVEPFMNFELYELMCELLGISPNPNNGTKGSLHHLLRHPKTLPAPSMTTVINAHYSSSCIYAQEIAVERSINIRLVLYSKHVPVGIPNIVYKDSFIWLCNKDYVIGYHKKFRLPLWASFTLSSTGTYKGIEMFWKEDPRVLFDESSKCCDYRDPNVSDYGFVQSPLFPSKFANVSHLDEVSLLTNSVPKQKNHVVLFERHFFEIVSRWVRMRKSVNVVAGPVFDFNEDGLLPDENKITNNENRYGNLIIPTHYFYIVTWCRTKNISISECNPYNLDVVSFLFPNFPIAYSCQGIEELIKEHLARVVDIENLTGISFFSGLPIYAAIRLRTKVPEY